MKENTTLRQICIAYICENLKNYNVDNMPEHLCHEMLDHLHSTGQLAEHHLVKFLNHGRTHLNISRCSHLRRSVLREIGIRCPNLQVLDMSHCKQLNNGTLSFILLHCTNIRCIYLRSCDRISAAAFDSNHVASQEPESVPSSTALLISAAFPPSSPAAVHPLPIAFHHSTVLPEIKKLVLSNCSQIDDDALAYIVRLCPALASLNVSHCKRISDAGIRHVLRALPSLVSLDLSFCSRITPAAFAAIRHRATSTITTPTTSNSSSSSPQAMCPSPEEDSAVMPSNITTSMGMKRAHSRGLRKPLTLMRVADLPADATLAFNPVDQQQQLLHNLHLYSPTQNSSQDNLTNANSSLSANNNPSTNSDDRESPRDQHTPKPHTPTFSSNVNSHNKNSNTTSASSTHHHHHHHHRQHHTSQPQQHHQCLLRKLRLNGLRLIDDSAIQIILLECSNLELLSLRFCDRLTDRCIALPQPFVIPRTLTSLDAQHCSHFTNSSLRIIAENMPFLRNLSLSWMDLITDAGVGLLSRDLTWNVPSPEVAFTHPTFVSSRDGMLVTSNLTDVKISHCRRVTDFGIAKLIAHSPNLRSIDVSYCTELKGSFVELISRCPHLRNLSVEGCTIFRFLISTTNSHVSTYLPVLLSLNIGHTATTDTDIAWISSNCPRLRTLAMGAVRNIAPPSISNALSSCKQLRELDVSQCHLNNEWVMSAFGLNVEPKSLLQMGSKASDGDVADSSASATSLPVGSDGVWGASEPSRVFAPAFGSNLESLNLTGNAIVPSTINLLLQTYPNISRLHLHFSPKQSAALLLQTQVQHQTQQQQQQQQQTIRRTQATSGSSPSLAPQPQPQPQSQQQQQQQQQPAQQQQQQQQQQQHHHLHSQQQTTRLHHHHYRQSASHHSDDNAISNQCNHNTTTNNTISNVHSHSNAGVGTGGGETMTKTFLLDSTTDESGTDSAVQNVLHSHPVMQHPALCISASRCLRRHTNALATPNLFDPLTE